MTEFADWPPLHDAVINSICVRWPGAVGTITLGTVDDEILEIVATGLTDLSCPQHCPWGTAKYSHINEARFSKSRGLVRLEIETQGGDLVVMEAASITLQVIRAGQPDRPLRDVSS